MLTISIKQCAALLLILCLDLVWLIAQTGQCAFASPPPLWHGSSGSSTQNFGVASSLIHRIEEQLSNAQNTLNNNDYYDFQSRLYDLKQSASMELSRGADASTILQPLQSLEAEINNKTHETGQLNGTRRGQLDLSLLRLEALLKTKSSELNQEDWSKCFNQISDLKTRSLQNAYASDEAIEKLTIEAHDIESKLMDRVMFSPHKGTLTFTREEPPDANSHAKDSMFEKQKEGDSSLRVKDGTETKNSTLVRAPKKTPIAIPVLIEQIENQMINYHEKHQIGSFDMDSFSERLLAQKRNLHVMMSKTGRISARQEVVIRSELEQLQEELVNRVTGKH